MNMSPFQIGPIALMLALIATTRLGIAEELTFYAVKIDGPEVTGIIDTAADTLSVTAWTENAGGPAYWTPQISEFPIVLVANFDVPDGWDGTLSLTDKFDGEPISSYQWNEGMTTNSSLLELGDVNLISTWGAQHVIGGEPTNFLFDSVTVQPVPEPAAAVLLVVATAGLLVGGPRKGVMRLRSRLRAIT